jgi:hypothetical protein
MPEIEAFQTAIGFHDVREIPVWVLGDSAEPLENNVVNLSICHILNILCNADPISQVSRKHVTLVVGSGRAVDRE